MKDLRGVGMRRIFFVAVVLVVLLIIGRGLSIGDVSEDSLSVGFEETRTEQIYTIPGFSAPTHTAATNRGNIDAFVFIEVSVPVISSTDVDIEEDVKVRKDGYVPVMEFEPQAPWLLVEEEVRDDVLHQVFCYGELTPIKPGETTPNLFDKWSVVNCHVVNGRTGEMSWSTIASLCPETRISISSIQTNIGSDLTPKSVWTMLK